MDWTETPRERRRRMRVRSKGSVRFHHGAQQLRGRILDLGVGGICVRVEPSVGLGVYVGEPIGLEVRLDASTKKYALDGRVLRSLAASGVIAVELHGVPSDFERCVEDELVAAGKHDAVPHMILVDIAVGRRHAIAGAFRSAGCHVTEVSTPLDAIAELGRLRFAPGVIAIADSIPESIAEDLRAFLGREHPDAHMVAIGSSNRHPNLGGSWLSWVNTRNDLDLRVGRVITAHEARRRSTKSLPRARR
ncbi:MAG: PilZ domain-containing protein [bacterium]